MGSGLARVDLRVTDKERRVLEGYCRRRKTSRGLAQRAEIILVSASGDSDIAVAKKLRVSRLTVGKWRRRFLKARLDGLLDEPRPGAPRSVSDEKVEEVVALTLEATPKGATHWSSRDMAKRVGLSHMTVSRIWRAFGLQPHRTETFKLSPDPLLVEKVRDIVGLYMNPPDNALVLCVDEKSQIQALERTQPLLPMRPGQIERRTHDYKRHGTTSLFAALHTVSGRVIGQLHRRHRAIELRKFLTTIDEQVPEQLEVHLIMDNLSTHKSPSIKSWLAKRPRYHVHFTPTYGSWLNLVERWFALLEQRQLKRGSHRSRRELDQAIKDFIDVTNDTPKPFVWTKTADAILASIARFAQRTLATQGES
ncbi:MAG TPA: IS630 family transposase [Methylomirabilota bacterium]